MKEEKDLRLSLLSPPGDTLKEHIDFIGMKQTELAKHMGFHEEKINAIILGREPISNITANQLEKALDIPASFWLNLENDYRREIYQIEHEEV